MEKLAPIQTKFDKTFTLHDKPSICRAIRKSIKIRNKMYEKYCKEKYHAKN